MDIAIVGAGRMGRVHAAALRHAPSAQVVAVVDTDAAVAADLAAPLGAAVYTDLSDLLATRPIDIVDIVTPHHAHASAVSTALDAGAHVLCEKPIALSVGEASELVRRAADRGRRLLVKSYQRYSTAICALRDSLLGGRIGRPYLLVGSFASTQLGNLADPADWHGDLVRCGGGVLVDAGYHLVDLAHFCFGPAVEISATVQRGVSPAASKGEDVAAVTLSFASGALASLVATWADTSLPLRFEYRAYCTDGMTELRQSDGRSRVRVFSRHEQIADAVEDEWWGSANARAVSELVEDIRTGRPSSGEARESIRTLASVFAAYDSASSGRAVRLPAA